MMHNPMHKNKNTHPMEYVYCGGRFHFDYLEAGFREKAALDYRAVLLRDVDLLLQNAGPVKLSEGLTYVGPFYFQTDGMLDRDIVAAEREQIRSCTTAVFLLDGGPCPGTIAELVCAASLGKTLRVCYLRDERETESTLASPFWYPMLLCRELHPARVTLIPCADPAEARDQLLKFLRKL